MMQNTNWVFDKSLVSEIDKKTLKKAKEIEKKELAKGYKWVRINSRTEVLVECDKYGNPTEKGKRMIEEYKKL